MYKGNPTAFHFSRIFCFWDDNKTADVSVAVAAFPLQDEKNKLWRMKNVTQITAIARIKGKKNTAKMLRELYEHTIQRGT